MGKKGWRISLDSSARAPDRSAMPETGKEQKQPFGPVIAEKMLRLIEKKNYLPKGHFLLHVGAWNEKEDTKVREMVMPMTLRYCFDLDFKWLDFWKKAHHDSAVAALARGTT